MVCARLRTIQIEVLRASGGTLREDTLLSVVERISVPRRQAHPLTVRVDGESLTSELGDKLGVLLDLPREKTMGQIKRFEIPTV